MYLPVTVSGVFFGLSPLVVRIFFCSIFFSEEKDKTTVNWIQYYNCCQYTM